MKLCRNYVLGIANDGAVKLLRQKDETKTEIETKISELFSNFKTIRLSEQKGGAVMPFRDFTKNKSSVNKTMRFLKPRC